jgi:hypothetical protein
MAGREFQKSGCIRYGVEGETISAVRRFGLVFKRTSYEKERDSKEDALTPAALNNSARAAPVSCR